MFDSFEKHFLYKFMYSSGSWCFQKLLIVLQSLLILVIAKIYGPTLISHRVTQVSLTLHVKSMP